MKHPDARTLNEFREARLPATTLLEVSDHVAACSACRAELASNARASAGSALSAFLADDGAAHLGEEELAQAAANEAQLTTEAREHLHRCAACRAEVEDARTFAGCLPAAGPAAKSARGAWKVWALPIAAVLIVGALVGVQMHRHTEPATLALLRDGDTELRLTTDGRLVIPEKFSSQQRDLLAQVMRDGRLPSGPGDSTMTEPSRLRGIPSTGPAFRVIAPLGVAEIQPEFRWEPLAGARSYRVEVYDAQFRKAAASEPLNSDAWRPAQPLQPGTQYTWVVRAMTAHGEVQAPVPPAQEARFRTVDAETEQALQVAKAQHSPLLLAAIYARAGLVDAARVQVDALEKENPGSPLVQRLKASLPAGQGLPSTTKPAQ